MNRLIKFLNSSLIDNVLFTLRSSKRERECLVRIDLFENFSFHKYIHIFSVSLFFSSSNGNNGKC